MYIGQHIFRLYSEFFRYGIPQKNYSKIQLGRQVSLPLKQSTAIFARSGFSLEM